MVLESVLALLVAAAVFVSLAVDAGRYRWAIELIGRSVDSVVARARAARALVRRA